jgi:cell division protein FtsI/penicillin-binding protein 2
MKKTALVILICIIGIIFFYCYQQIVEQKEKMKK